MSMGELCVCVLCVAERHSAGLHFSDKRWWVSAERAWGGGGGGVVGVWHPARGLLMVGGHQAPIATPPPITHYSPHPTPPPSHSPFLSGEMRGAARWLTLPDASQLVAVTAAVALPLLQHRGVTESNPSSDTPLGPSRCWNWTPRLLQIARSLTGCCTRGCATPGWIHHLD